MTKPEQAVSPEGFLIAILVAMLAILLGALGPRFRWRGAASLCAVMIGGGLLATTLAAREAEAAGMRFGITPMSVVSALLGQAVFSLGFYLLGVVTACLVHRLAALVAHISARRRS